MAASSESPFALSVAFGDYPLTRGFRAAPVAGGKLACNVIGIGGTAIADMLARQAFDACEMPIVTFLQAFARRAPLLLLPVTLVSRHQHGTILYDASRGELAPADLAGRRIGVRSWTRTTGVWARGILAHDYGVDAHRIDWVTFEPSHIAPHSDPSRRASPEQTALAMLFAGELDAVIGETSNDPRLRAIIPDSEKAARDWSLRNGFIPVNHMVVVSERLVRDQPEAVALIWSALAREWRPPGNDSLDATPMGIGANRPALDTIICYAIEQGIIPPGISADDLFGAAVRRTIGE